MPYKPRRACREPGCGQMAAARSSYCVEHQAKHDKEYNATRPDDIVDFYNSGAWRALRNRFIAENPLCRVCLLDGKMRPAAVVDHIIPIRQGGARLDPKNLQSLCVACHGRKSIEEGSRFGKRRRG